MAKNREEFVKMSETGKPESAKIVEFWKRCPICAPEKIGVGATYCTHEAKPWRYLRCGDCGHTWSVHFNADGFVEQLNGVTFDERGKVTAVANK